MSFIGFSFISFFPKQLWWWGRGTSRSSPFAELKILDNLLIGTYNLTYKYRECRMGQVTIYLDDEVESKMRAFAKAMHLSQSK
jgi:hypothetical protein